MTDRPVTTLAMDPALPGRLLTPAERDRLHVVSDVDFAAVVTDFADPGHADRLTRTEVLFTCWGCPELDERALAAMPALRAVVHAAGSVRHHLTEAAWRRGLLVSSAAAANAVPVAEFTVAAILLANKRVWDIQTAFRAERRDRDWSAAFPDMGNVDKTVGVVGASRIGRRVLDLLRPFDLELLVHDPYLPAAEAVALGAAPVDLDELVARSDVVTLHAPALPETRHLIDRRRLALMRPGATLINTARGALVDTSALVVALAEGRVRAVLDVTDPDPLPVDSPLFDLPNVQLTPHIAGSLGVELRRMARSAVAEVARYAAGQPFRHPVTEADLATVA